MSPLDLQSCMKNRISNICFSFRGSTLPVLKYIPVLFLSKTPSDLAPLFAISQILSPDKIASRAKAGILKWQMHCKSFHPCRNTHIPQQLLSPRPWSFATGTQRVLCSILHLTLTLQLHADSISTACAAVTALNPISVLSKELFGSSTRSGTNCMFLYAI